MVYAFAYSNYTVEMLLGVNETHLSMFNGPCRSHATAGGTVGTK